MSCFVSPPSHSCYILKFTNNLVTHSKVTVFKWLLLFQLRLKYFRSSVPCCSSMLHIKDLRFLSVYPNEEARWEIQENQQSVHAHVCVCVCARVRMCTPIHPPTHTHYFLKEEKTSSVNNACCIIRLFLNFHKMHMRFVMELTPWSCPSSLFYRSINVHDRSTCYMRKE